MTGAGEAGADEQAPGRLPKRPAAWPLRRAWRLLAHYLRPTAGRVALAAVLLLAAIALQLANPQVIRFFLDTAQTGGAGRSLLLAALAYVGFAVLQQVMNLGSSYTSQRVSWSATNRLRTDLALHVLRLDLPFHKQQHPRRADRKDRWRCDPTGELLFAVFHPPVEQCPAGAGDSGAARPRESTGGLAMALYTAVTLAVIGLIQRLATRRWAAARQASAEQYGYIEERISGVEDIRAAGVEAFVMRGLYQRMRAFLSTTRAASCGQQSHLEPDQPGLRPGLCRRAGPGRGTLQPGPGHPRRRLPDRVLCRACLAEPLQAIRAQVQDCSRLPPASCASRNCSACTRR